MPRHTVVEDPLASALPSPFVQSAEDGPPVGAPGMIVVWPKYGLPVTSLVSVTPECAVLLALQTFHTLTHLGQCNIVHGLIPVGKPFVCVRFPPTDLSDGFCCMYVAGGCVELVPFRQLSSSVGQAAVCSGGIRQ